MLKNGGGFFLRTQDQPNVFDGIQRFRTVRSKSLLDRGTVRRVGVRGSILEFAFERKNMLLHIFRLEAKRPRDKAGQRKSRELARRVEDLNGRGLAKFLRDEGRAPIKPQTVLLSVEASAGSGGRSGEARKIKEWS